ncbi:MAG: carbohydrate binding family 9 domain-containing protein, partial [Gemmatimonadota bacterium]|nr:carbohydrate binding family 9 domain-containing protein [Gemmatimonadota bacterium]
MEVDGRLVEEAWAAADPVGSFIQREPTEGAPAAEPTEVRVLFDDDAVYVGARMHDSTPRTIARQLVRRDEGGQYDFFEVSLSPAGDRRTGYQFRVSAAGVQGDTYLFDDVRDDDVWNAVWESAVEVDSLGWTAELR